VITSGDDAYRKTKRIKQGRATLSAPFAELAAWISAQWQVTVLNILHELPELLEGRPRLRVVLEHPRERRVFEDESGYDESKQQAVAARFAEIVGRDRRHSRYSVAGLLVVFTAFSPLALEEADGRLSKRRIRALQKRAANPQLWTIHRWFGRVTFMFHTDEQAQAAARSGLRERYADLYFALLRKHDEFGYLNRAEFSVELDSKENLDRNYGGSWFNYDR
jgi:hypothetical protein